MLIFECLKVSRPSMHAWRLTLSSSKVLLLVLYNFVSATCWMRMNLFVNLDQKQFKHSWTVGDSRVVTLILISKSLHIWFTASGLLHIRDSPQLVIIQDVYYSPLHTVLGRVRIMLASLRELVIHHISSLRSPSHFVTPPAAAQYRI